MGRELNLDVTAAKLPDDEDWNSFTINGDEDDKFFFLDPTEEEIGLYMALFRTGGGVVDQLAGTLDFLENIMDEESFAAYSERLKDRQDPYVTLETTTRILELLFQESTGFPTKRQSGSTSSQRSTGKPLTDRLPPKASRRVRSPQNVSATSSTGGSTSE